MDEIAALEDAGAARHRSRQTAKTTFKAMNRNFVIKFPRGKGVIAYVYEDLCMGCIHCADNCPENIRPDHEDAIVMVDQTAYLPELRFETRKARIVEETCIGCAKCAVICPVEAIVMVPRPGWEVVDNAPAAVQSEEGTG
ncbi:MAG: ATP-binding protein [Thermoplasmata archaeon]